MSVDLADPTVILNLLSQCQAINQNSRVIPDDVIADLQRRLRLALQLPDPKAVKP